MVTELLPPIRPFDNGVSAENSTWNEPALDAPHDILDFRLCEVLNRSISYDVIISTIGHLCSDVGNMERDIWSRVLAFGNADDLWVNVARDNLL